MPYAPRATLDNPYGPQVTFRTEDVLPPPAYYVSPDDRIVANVLTDMAGLTLNLQMRLLTPQGEIKLMPYQFTQPALNHYSMAYEFNPVEGYVLGVLCWAVDPPRGRCFVSVSIVRGIPPGLINAGLVLVQGYTNLLNVLSYPTTPLQSTFDGRGAQITLDVTPLGPAEWAATVPPLTLWRVVSASFYLVTTAAGATRTVYVVVRDTNAKQFAYWGNGYGQAPNTTVTYGFSPGGSVSNTPTIQTMTGPDLIYLPAGYTIASFTDGRQTGDAFGLVLLGVEEWLGE